MSTPKRSRPLIKQFHLGLLTGSVAVTAIVEYRGDETFTLMGVLFGFLVVLAGSVLSEIQGLTEGCAVCYDSATEEEGS